MSLEFIIGRLHVGVADATVRAYIAGRLRKDLSAKERRRVLDRAVRIHRRNRRMYNDVISGRIGR